MSAALVGRGDDAPDADVREADELRDLAVARAGLVGLDDQLVAL